MFKLFNKKQPKTAIKKAIEKKLHPYNPDDYKADLTALYNCSVQKTVFDFPIQYCNLDGELVRVAMDSADACDVKGLQNVYQPNMLGQEIIFTEFASRGFIGFNNCAILAQDWLVNKACSLPCKDAIAIKYDVTLNADDNTPEDKDVITDLRKLDKKFRIDKTCQEFAENKRKFGQSLCIPIVEGVDYSNPFNIDAVAPKSYKGMINIEPIWVTPILDTEATTNPCAERFYQPTWFRLPNGQVIHYSWFIFNTYSDVPDILKPSYYFGGYPLPQLLYEQVYAAEKTAKEAPMLAQSKRLNYIEGNLNQFINNSDLLAKSLDLVTRMRNNWGWLFVGREQKIGQIDTTLTDFDAVTMLGFQIVAAISGVQAVRLLETSPKGWQSSGSLEDKNYSKLLLQIQTEDYCPILDNHYMLLAKSEFNLDKTYTCIFDPIDTPTEKERAEIREINSRTDINYIQAGVVAPDEVRDIVREDINSGYNALQEEMEETENLFNEFGGSSNGQSPFSQDEEPKEWITTKTKARIPIYKNESKKEAIKEFAEEKGNIEKSAKRDKIKEKQRKEIQLPKDEYAQVIHELNTNLTKEEHKKKQITKCIGNCFYTILNNGFNEYKIIGKQNIDDIYN